ncbi:hypothetical protein CEXT_441651 [Caerostris extrusa]|uniref:Uncharacterized protein n=1 Tax=Caerostris extrusa TaxID=172846 RepID=A0AAV4X9G5_CAEEX|nr:hypothetical protein CEXT_441651 [Caerostris extrusa]
MHSSCACCFSYAYLWRALAKVEGGVGEGQERVITVVFFPEKWCFQKRPFPHSRNLVTSLGCRGNGEGGEGFVIIQFSARGKSESFVIIKKVFPNHMPYEKGVGPAEQGWWFLTNLFL